MPKAVLRRSRAAGSAVLDLRGYFRLRQELEDAIQSGSSLTSVRRKMAEEWYDNPEEVLRPLECKARPPFGGRTPPPPCSPMKVRIGHVRTEAEELAINHQRAKKAYQKSKKARRDAIKDAILEVIYGPGIQEEETMQPSTQPSIDVDQLSLFSDMMASHSRRSTPVATSTPLLQADGSPRPSTSRNGMSQPLLSGYQVTPVRPDQSSSSSD